MTERESILIVDDEQMIRRLLRGRLSDEGYRCYEAGNAEEALTELRNNVISLVLLDIKMPGKSGVELLPEIRASYPDTAVIMATAIGDTEVAVLCMKHGAYDYVSKPFSLDDVVLSVERALERRQLELEVRDYRQHLESKVAEQAEKIRASFLRAITSLAYALEARDKYTSGHSQRVAEIAVAIAVTMALPPDSVEGLRLAGLLHDIGKIGVRESVLNKPGRLTDEEFRHMQEHPEIGERVLAPVTDDGEILQLIRNHHERFDGTGYPDHLAGDRIPPGARILAVADSYEAMTSERPYRKAMSAEVALAELERCRGTQFDPQVVDAFLKCSNVPVSD